MIEKKKETVNCFNNGIGPAGYTAAIYAARANLNQFYIPVLSQTDS